jgi:hypothetical protein
LFIFYLSVGGEALRHPNRFTLNTEVSMKGETYRLILVTLVLSALIGLALLRPEAQLVEIGSVITAAALFAERLARV